MKRVSYSGLSLVLLSLFALTFLLVWAPSAQAYPDWSSCSNCHGNFLSSSYTSKAHGTPLTGGLHTFHQNMVSMDCGVCHTNAGGGTVPVYTYRSLGMTNGTQTLALGCSGCHDGPGLRTHHRTAGVSTCSGCHTNPETAQAENVARPYYFTPDAAHPNKPTDTCTDLLDNDGNGLYDSADPACTPLPAAPKADAGSPQTVASGDTVTLSGANSTGTSLTYQWTQTAGPAVTLAMPTAVTTTFVAPSVGTGGASLTFQLTVTDSANQTSSATTTVNVTYVDVPPVADAGPNQTVSAGTPVTLDGSNSSDPDGTLASYQWAQTAGPAVTLSNAAAARPTFVAPTVGAAGASLTFLLTVTDDAGLTATATTVVNVTYVDQPPVADAGPSQTVTQGTAVTLDGSNSSDPDGSIVSYRWAQTAGPAVTLSNAAVAKPTFVAPTVGTAGASLTFQLTVTDDAGLTATGTTVVNVTYVDQPPVADAGPSQTVPQGTLVTLDGSGSSDPDGTVVSYLWTQTAGPSVTLSNPAAVAPTFTAPPVGTAGASLTFHLTVTDDAGLTATATTVVNVTDVNQPPVADAGTDQTVFTGTTVTLDGSGSSDPDGTVASYLWTQTAGPSVSLSDPASVSPTFTAPSAASALTFQLKVTDDGGLFSTATVAVTVEAAPTVNQPPVADAGTDQTVAAGASVTLDGSQSYDPEGTALSYLWEQTVGAPVALSASSSAVATFTAPSTSGALTFQLTVTDADGLSATSSVTIQITGTQTTSSGDGLDGEGDEYDDGYHRDGYRDEDGAGTTWQRSRDGARYYRGD